MLVVVPGVDVERPSAYPIPPGAFPRPVQDPFTQREAVVGE
jgi:hypothetical protein